jgi:hypothetical protein
MVTDTKALQYPLHVSLSPSAFQSWVKSTHRLLKTIQCPKKHHAIVRRGMLLCTECGRGWPLDDIQDLIEEIEAGIDTSVSPASSPTAPGNVPSLSANPRGCSISTEAHRG